MTAETFQDNSQNFDDAPAEVFVFPASFSQQRLWFLQQIDLSNTAYHLMAPFRIKGKLHAEILEMTFNEIVRRHETLRTTFRMIDRELMQLIAPSKKLPFEIIKLKSLPESQQEAKIEQIINEQTQTPFDLANGALIRATLLKISEFDHILILVMHHIISDGWSLGVLVNEASTLYNALLENDLSTETIEEISARVLPELSIQYADYSVWQRDWLEGEVLEKQLDYWKSQLADAPAALELPVDFPRKALSAPTAAQLNVNLNAELSKELRHLARRSGATLYMVLLAVFQLLLARYSRQDDISVGSPIAGRTRRETENLIGFFVNTLLMRTRFSRNLTVKDLISRVKETTLSAYTHQDIPFEKLVEVLAPERDLSRTPLFQVMFILQNAPLPDLQLGEAKLEMLEAMAGTAKFEITMSLEESNDEITGYVEYNAELFEKETIQRMLAHFEKLADSFVKAEESANVWRLPMLSGEEIRQLTDEWNATAVEYEEKCLHELFEEQAAKMPDAVAVSGREGKLTYRKLNERANRLARFLRQKGVKPETFVGIFAEPSIEMLIGVLAVIKAGGAYIPIEPTFPADRIADIIAQSEIKLILAQSGQTESFIESAVEIVKLGGGLEIWREFEAENLPNLSAPTNAVYAIYTSGSTGRAKGVVVEHRQIVNYLRGIVRRFDLQPGLNYAMLQSLAVDSSNTVLIPSIAFGGTLHVLPQSWAADADAVAEYFETNRMDILKITPSHLAILLDSCDSPNLLPRKILALGGEATQTDWLRKTVFPRANAEMKVFIHYGPTETTVGVLTNPVASENVSRGAQVPLGSPLANSQIYILSEHLEFVPIGVTGEIYIGGDGVTRGYLNRPDLTAERFIPDFIGKTPGARLYKTGDRGRFLPDQTVEFLGRTDFQVKIRGFRVEPGEVEAVLLEHPAVNQAITKAFDDQNGKSLAAYLTLKADSNGIGQAELKEELRRLIGKKLPYYMSPSSIEVLDALPLTTQGKISLKDLPDPTPENILADSAILPQNPTEIRLAAIWRELLKVNEIGTNTDFFRVGGHSLLAMRMLNMIREEFEQSVPVAAFLQNPTIAFLAKLLHGKTEKFASEILVNLQRGGESTPFFCVHPIDGNIMCYTHLSAALGREQTFYALQTPAGDIPASIEELAEIYVNEIREKLPQKSYLLGGWSFGGLVAFEMARQFEQSGERVEMLALFDTYPPQINTDKDLPRIARFAAGFAGTLGLNPKISNEEFLQTDFEGQREILIEELRNAGLIDRDSVEDFDRIFSVFERLAAAADKYRLRPFNQKSDLFVAADGEGVEKLPAVWSEITGGEINVEFIRGDHYSILKPPNVAELAEKLKQRFGRLENTRSKFYGET